MSISAAFLLFAAACALTSLGLWLFLRLQPRLGLLDVPNERSSHSTPVPRGGGVVIAMVALSIYGVAGGQPNVVFVLGASAIAAISLLDDIRSMPLLPRLAVHFVAAAAIVWSTGGYESVGLPFAGSSVDLGTLAKPLSVILIVWLINAYNFMDGIDGILGVQGLTAGLGIAAFGLIAGAAPVVSIAAAVSGACLGFIFFNWHPARVFSGDVGSTFVGFALATAPLLDKPRADAGGVGLIIVIAVSILFLFDTIYTRIVLIAGGRKFWLPHRDHLYQKLVRGGVSHRSVALYFGFAGAVISGAAVWPATRGAALVAGVAAGVVLLLWARKKFVDPAGTEC